MKRTCTKCGAEKDAALFRKRVRHDRKGYIQTIPYCRRCEQDYNTNYMRRCRAALREKVTREKGKHA